MLIRFTVGNFKSFKERSSILLEPSKDDWREDDNIAHTVEPPLRLLKVAAIYGQNGGGKSNLIEAMVRFREFVLGSSKDSQQGEVIAVTPFKLDTVSENSPTFFEAVFLVSGTRYRYGFEVTRREVISEWLFKQKGSIRETPLFTRESGAINLRRTFKEGRGLEERTRANALFLSVVAQFNGAIAGEVMAWIERFRAVSGQTELGYANFTANLLKDPEYGPAIREFVRKADTGIEDLIQQKIDKDQFAERLPKSLPEAIRDLFMQSASSGVTTLKSIHSQFDSSNDPSGKVEFDFATEESNGTQRLLALAGPFLHSLREGTILVVDEIDTHLHPLLTRQLIALFNNFANKRNAQLIFSTHDQGLLNKKQLRRDQIWFIEKDQFGVSDLFCLGDVKGVRREANFEREYLLGLFGGIPQLGNLQEVIADAAK